MKTASPDAQVGDLNHPMCPSRTVLSHVTSRWGALVLLMLRDKIYRFGELRKRIGNISEKMLAQTLQLLEEDGFVHREAYPEVPPKVEYSLTALGQEVTAHLAALGTWIEQNLPRMTPAQYAGKPAGRPLNSEK